MFQRVYYLNENKETSVEIEWITTGSPGSMLAVRIDPNLRQCMRISWEICSKCDNFEKFK